MGKGGSYDRQVSRHRDPPARRSRRLPWSPTVLAEGGAALPLTPHHEALTGLFMPPRKTCGVPEHTTCHPTFCAVRSLTLSPSHPFVQGPILNDRARGEARSGREGCNGTFQNRELSRGEPLLLRQVASTSGGWGGGGGFKVASHGRQ